MNRVLRTDQEFSKPRERKYMSEMSKFTQTRKSVHSEVWRIMLEPGAHGAGRLGRSRLQGWPSRDLIIREQATSFKDDVTGGLLYKNTLNHHKSERTRKIRKHIQKRCRYK